MTKERGSIEVNMRISIFDVQIIVVDVENDASGIKPEASFYQQQQQQKKSMHDRSTRKQNLYR